MPSFINNAMTSAGLLLLAKGIAGAEIKFTKLQIGKGFLPEGVSPSDLAGLVEPVADISILRCKVLDNGSALVGGDFNNREIEEGFYYRELGLYAQDPDVGEILYCYGNSDNLAEWIPPIGTPTVIEKRIDIITQIDTATNVTAYFSEQLYVSREEFEAMELEIVDLRGNVDQINAKLATCPTMTQSDMTIYVATTGSDETGDGTQGNPYATINYALSLVPKLLLHDVTINVAAGTYDEDVKAVGFWGKSLAIVGNNNITTSGYSGHVNYKVKTFFAYGCSASTTFLGFQCTGKIAIQTTLGSILTTGTTQITTRATLQVSIAIINSTSVSLGVYINTTVSGTNCGIYGLGSFVEMYPSNYIANQYFGVYSDGGNHFYMVIAANTSYSLTMTGNTTDLCACKGYISTYSSGSRFTRLIDMGGWICYAAGVFSTS